MVSYGVIVTTLQRLLRIRHPQLRRDYSKLLEEWRNIGHENWNSLVFPDWLLLEIDSDLLIRPEQIDVVYTIILLELKSNSILLTASGLQAYISRCLRVSGNIRNGIRLYSRKGLRMLPPEQVYNECCVL